MCPACLTAASVPPEGLRWTESQHSVSPRARGGDRDGPAAGAGGTLPSPSASLTPAWSRQRELLMHLLPWYTAAAAAAAQVQPGNQSERPRGAGGGVVPLLLSAGRSPAHPAVWVEPGFCDLRPSGGGGGVFV